MKTETAPLAGRPTPRPVTAGPSAADRVLRRVLVPLDFSVPSLKALDYAVALAAPVGAAVQVVHVVEPSASFTALDGNPLVFRDDEVMKNCESRLRALAARTGTTGAAPSCTVRLGDPVQEID